jgi:Spy/CpxP family protein refolding chaperone
MIRAWTTTSLTRAIVMMVVLVGAAGLAQPAAGQGMEAEVGRGGPWGRDGGTALPFLIRSANLTPEQETKVRTILSAHRTGTRATLDQLRRAQDELADKLLAAAPIQTADLQPQLQQIGQLREQLLQDSAQIALEVRAVLTPEQLAKAAQVKARMKQLQGEMQHLFERPVGRRP